MTQDQTKAIVVQAYGGADQLQWQDVPTPQPAKGQVRLRTLLTSVNFADIMSRRGGYGPGTKPPFIPGLDVVGEVEALGEGVDTLRVGQRVMAFPKGGSYATRVVAPANLCYPVPDGLSNEAVSSVTVLVTAYNVLTLAGRLQPSETVLIHAAAGGVGTTAIQMARALGAGRVIGTAGSGEKVRHALDTGADDAINYRTEDFAERVKALTGGRGPDLILDSIGGQTLKQGLGILAPFGRLVTFGQAGGEVAHIETPPLHRENRAVIGYSTGHYRNNRPEALRPGVEAALRLVQEGKVSLKIGSRYRLQDAAKAQQAVEDRETTGKVLLEIGE